MEQLILISIKTKYANQIFNGTKLYEYRRKSIGEKNCNKKIFVYALKIVKAVKFKTPIYLREIKKEEKNFVVPQFYRYIKENEYIYEELKEGKSL